MGFRFSLQRVMEMREEHLNACEMEFDRLNRIVLELRKMLNNERDTYFNERETLNQHVRNSELHRIPVFDGSLEMRKRKMIQILETLKQAQLELELAEQTLIQARRDLKVLQNLRDKKLVEYNLAVDKKERKQLDEFASQKYARAEHMEKKRSES